jgi:hypothetical protein
VSDAEAGFAIGRWIAGPLWFLVVTRLSLWLLTKVTPWTTRLAVSHTLVAVYLEWLSWSRVGLQGSDTGHPVLEQLVFLLGVILVTLFDARRLRRRAALVALS